MKQYNIALDIMKATQVPFLSFSQADKNAHELRLAVKNNDVAYNLNAHTTKVYTKKRSGSVELLHTVIDNVITVRLSEIALNEVGKCTIEVHISQTSKRLALMQFAYNVTPSIALEFENLADELSLWQQVMNRVEALENNGGSGVSDWNTISNKPSTFPPSTHTHSEYAATSHTHDYATLTNKPTIPTVDVTKSYVDTQLATKSNVVSIISKSVVANTLTLGTEPLQQLPTDIPTGTTIALPSVSTYTEIRLLVSTGATAPTLTLPAIKWQSTPSIAASKVYEFCFMYVNATVGWIGGVVQYG